MMTLAQAINALRSFRVALGGAITAGWGARQLSPVARQDGSQMFDATAQPAPIDLIMPSPLGANMVWWPWRQYYAARDAWNTFARSRFGTFPGAAKTVSVTAAKIDEAIAALTAPAPVAAAPVVVRSSGFPWLLLLAVGGIGWYTLRGKAVKGRRRRRRTTRRTTRRRRSRR